MLDVAGVAGGGRVEGLIPLEPPGRTESCGCLQLTCSLTTVPPFRLIPMAALMRKACPGGREGLQMIRMPPYLASPLWASVALLELVHATSRVDRHHLAGVVRMAGVADIQLTSGYSLPSSHFIVSLVAAQLLPRNMWSLLMSLKTTMR